MSNIRIIPKPLSVESSEGQCLLPAVIPIIVNTDAVLPSAQRLIDHFQTRLRTTANLCESSDPSTVRVSLSVVPARTSSLDNLQHSQEAYELSVSEEQGVAITALTATGVSHGVQTLLQLLPVNVAENERISVPAVKIIDAPRFKWRGLLLDVGRHFFSVTFIKRVLDIMAFYKINIFHWHLTEDQGWRLEIRNYQKLTDFAAWRGGSGNSSKYGGFYTQNEVRDIIEYASKCGIEVVPEIEMPGHCSAALAAYPSLSCTGRVREVPTQWGVHEDVYCAGKEETFQFLEGVLSEVVDLFPSAYLHIGGDECPKTRWRDCPHCQQRMKDNNLKTEDELQSWFIDRIGKFLTGKGKKFIGWDEILEGGLADNAILMSWRGVGGGIEAVKEGHLAIMSPTSHCYFDYKQAAGAEEPGAWYALLPLETVYSFDPIPTNPRPASTAEPMQVNGNGSSAADGTQGSPESSLDESDAECSRGLKVEEQSNILGGQANLWTEFVADESTAAYMLLPRLAAIAESVWSPKESKNWENFKGRLQDHTQYYDAAGWQYRKLD